MLPFELVKLVVSTVKRPYEIFGFAGQSNASGRASFIGYSPPVVSRIYNYANDGQWKIAAEPIDDATGQIDTVSIDEEAGVSPALAFAVEYQRLRPGTTVGLVPAAKGGSGILAWRGHLMRTTLYGSCLARMLEAKSRGRIAGMVFLQGEADAKSEQSAALWGERFTELVANWREDLGDPNLPVVFMQLSGPPGPQQTHWDLVKAEQAAINIPGVSMVITEDLPIDAGLHFDTSGYIELGRRLAVAMNELVT